jgi:hypothetical protein
MPPLKGGIFVSAATPNPLFTFHPTVRKGFTPFPEKSLPPVSRFSYLSTCEPHPTFNDWNTCCGKFLLSSDLWLIVR